MPAERQTPTRGVRVPDDLWQAAREAAAARGETVSAVIVRALEHYARSNGWAVDPVTMLERLAGLRERGALTDAEFHAAKVDLLARL